MLLSKALTPALIQMDVESETKEELFEEMTDLLVSAGLIKDREEAVATLWDREEKMSTGISPGFALPHGRLADIKGCVMAMGIIRKGMDFDSLDGEPVYVVIVLFSEAGNATPHIEALGEISRLISIPDFVPNLLKAKTKEQVLKMIAELE